MCNSFCARCTLLNIFAGSVTGADVCTSLGSVDSTDSRQAAVYIHLGILQIRIGAVIGFAGSIGNRLEFARTPDKVVRVPFVAVVNVDALAAGNGQISAFGNAYLNAGQQCGVLVDGDFSELNVDAVSEQVPALEVAEPVIVVPVAPHASSAVPLKFKPMLASVRPITVPLVAANAGSVMVGSKTSTIAAANSSERKRLDIRWIMIVFSFSV